MYVGKSAQEKELRTVSGHEYDRERLRVFSHVINQQTEFAQAISFAIAMGYRTAGANDLEAIALQPPIRLSLGGYQMVLRPVTVMKRPGITKLHRFVRASHEQRMLIADAYMHDTGEYFFERSALTFNPIYSFFVTGQLHKPERICPHDFLHELAYWEIPTRFVEPCCRSQLTNLYRDLADDMSDSDDEIIRKQFERDRTKFKDFRHKLWLLMEQPDSSFWAQVSSLTSIFFVVLSTGMLIGSSLPEFKQLSPIWKQLFDYAETACVGWFTFELDQYLAKMLAHPNCALSSLIDLCAILPFYIEFGMNRFVEVDQDEVEKVPAPVGGVRSMFLVIRVLRVVRVARVFKLGKYSRGLQVFVLAMRMSYDYLSMFFLILFTACTFFSISIYFIEKDSPDEFKSIPWAFWWSYVTMATVGYGDLVPVTLFGSLCIASGVLVLAVPIPVFIHNWVNAELILAAKYKKRRKRFTSHPNVCDELHVDHDCYDCS